jgi:hypothetical protein
MERGFKSQQKGSAGMIGIVDRFEDGYVVIEVDGGTRDIPRKEVDANVKSGDVVGLIEGKWVTIEDETAKRTVDIKKLIDGVWED